MLRALRLLAPTLGVLWIILSGFLWASAASAQPLPREDTYETPRGVGLGTGVRASAISTTALSLNPAGLSAGNLYHAEATARYVPDLESWALGGAIVDSTRAGIGAGFGFRGILADRTRTHTGIDGRVGVGIPLTQAIGIGITGRYLRFSSDRVRPDNSKDTSESVRGFTLDGAIAGRFGALQVAALGHNLIDLHSALTPVLVGGSAAVAAGPWTVGADGLYDLTTFNRAQLILGGGAEVLVQGVFPIRAGYRYDAGRESQYLTGSLGYVDQGVGLDAALRQQVSGGSETVFVFSLRYHVQ